MSPKLMENAMKSLESNQEKVQQLCNLLQTQAIEPAQKQAREIVQEAKAKAAEIIAEAKYQAAALQAQAKAEMEKEKEVVESSLKQAARQAVIGLRKEIEDNLFGDRLAQLSKEVLSKEELLANLIKSYIQAVAKEGLSNSFSAFVANHQDSTRLAEAIGYELVSALREGKLVQTSLGGGFKLQLHDRHLTVDCTSEALTESLANYLRKDLRERLFAHQ